MFFNIPGPQDPESLLVLYERSAQLAGICMQTDLKELILHPSGVPKDPRNAFKVKYVQ